MKKENIDHRELEIKTTLELAFHQLENDLRVATFLFDKVLALDPTNTIASVGKKLATLALVEGGKEAFSEDVSDDGMLTRADTKDAYANSTTLHSVVIPDDVKEIAAGVCYKCANLTDVFIGKNVRDINEHCFRSCEKLNAFHVDSENRFFSSENGILYDKPKHTLLRAPTSRKRVVIPDGVTIIGELAFESNNIEKIILPDTLKEVNGTAFDGCEMLKFNSYSTGKYLGSSSNPYYALIKTSSPHISHIDIHRDTVIVGNLAFLESDCTSIYIPPKVEFIGSGAFFGCQSLENAYLPKSATFSPEFTFIACNKLKKIELYDDNDGFDVEDEEPELVRQLVHNRRRDGLCPACGEELSIKKHFFAKNRRMCKNCGDIDLY